MDERAHYKAKVILGDKADVQVLVDDKVWLGFFDSGGRVAMVDAEDLLLACKSHASFTALQTWIRERKQQATTIQA